VALTANQPIISTKNVCPNKLWKTVRTQLVPPNTTVIWGCWDEGGRAQKQPDRWGPKSVLPMVWKVRTKLQFYQGGW